MPNPVVHFEIQSNKPAELKKFYGDMFGWKITDMPGPSPYHLVDTTSNSHDGHGINGGIGGTGGPRSMVTFYIEVDDTDAFLKKIAEKGGKTIMPTTTIPDMVTFALFADPEGNVVGLVKSEQPRS